MKLGKDKPLSLQSGINTVESVRNALAFVGESVAIANSEFSDDAKVGVFSVLEILRDNLAEALAAFEEQKSEAATFPGS